jgi:hypothetical protein
MEGLHEANRGEHGNQGPAGVPRKRSRSWKRIHHSGLFWLALVLMLVAIAIYLKSDDLSFLPHPAP